MKYIIEFMKSIVYYEIVIVPIYMIGRYIYIKYINKNKKINIKKELLLLILIMSLIMILSQTILCEIYIEDGIRIKDGVHYNNFIPFKIIYDSYISYNINNNLNYFIINLLGNIIIFIPIGFIISYLYKLDTKYIILIGFLLSLFIELFQLLLPRWTDIDDIILNTLGVYIGYLIYKLYVRIYNKEK